MQRVWQDREGNQREERREAVAQRSLPPWVDYSVIVSLVGLVFWGGIQSNRLDTISKALDGHTQQLAVIIANDSKADVAVLKERSHAQDQGLSDLKDAILRRLDKMDTRLESRQIAPK